LSEIEAVPMASAASSCWAKIQSYVRSHKETPQQQRCHHLYCPLAKGSSRFFNIFPSHLWKATGRRHSIQLIPNNTGIRTAWLLFVNDTVIPRQAFWALDSLLSSDQNLVICGRGCCAHISPHFMDHWRFFKIRTLQMTGGRAQTWFHYFLSDQC
jgi:hypothetical protein